jgi:hypothetical protein
MINRLEYLYQLDSYRHYKGCCEFTINIEGKTVKIWYEGQLPILYPQRCGHITKHGWDR